MALPLLVAAAVLLAAHGPGLAAGQKASPPLACAGSSAAVPGGSWSDSCTNPCNVDGVVSATCKFSVTTADVSPTPSWVAPAGYSVAGATGIIGVALPVTYVVRWRRTFRIYMRYVRNTRRLARYKAWVAKGEFTEENYRELAWSGADLPERVTANAQFNLDGLKYKLRNEVRMQGIDTNQFDKKFLGEGGDNGPAGLEVAGDGAVQVDADTAFADGATATFGDYMGLALDANTVPIVGEVADVTLFAATAGYMIYSSVKNNQGYVGYLASSLNVTTMCAKGSGLINNNGVLNCETYNSNIPGGSWRGTCFNSHLNGTILTANCATGGFYWAPGGKAQGNVIAKVNTAAINTTYCQPGSDSLSNKNGMLGCTFEPSYGLPGGSWTSSCSPLKWYQGVLTALCNNKASAPTPTTITQVNYGLGCADGATLSNDNGALICSSGSARLPGGSWINSCGPIGFEKNVLTAYCGLTYSNGTQKLSVLNMTSCTNTGVTSTGGRLSCEVNPSAGLPGGSWSKSCTLFEWHADNTTIVAFCGLSDGALSAINYGLCAPGATLSNDHGVLICSSAAANMPAGSWVKSCAPVKYDPDNQLLAAQCSGATISKVFKGGAWRSLSVVNVSLCSSSGLQQDSGLLVCYATNPSLKLPGGNWVSSCSPLMWRPSDPDGSQMLWANCKTGSNSLFNFSPINYANCAPGSNINNKAGNLACSTINPLLPGGSAWSTCSPLSPANPSNISGGMISAQCKVNGYTSVNITACGSSPSLSNRNGFLSCTPKAPPNGWPGGSWFQSCTPRSWDAKSNILVARCSGNIDVTLNYGLCATGATVSYSSPTLLCSAMSTATTNVVGGTWVRSCSPVSLNGTTLAASCGKYAPSNPKRPDGIQQAVITTINAASCANNAVEVDNHVLVCTDGASKNLPSGSYVDSCTNVTMSSDRTTLSGVCHPAKVPVALGVTTCATGSSVSNHNGVLLCDTYLGTMPGGSWKSSCGALEPVTNGYFYAYCTDGSGGVSLSYNDVSKCPSGFQNIYGQLICE